MKIFKALLYILILLNIAGVSLSVDSILITPKDFEETYLSYTKKVINKLQCDNYIDKGSNGIIDYFITMIFNKDKKSCCSNIGNVDFITDTYNLIWNHSISLKNQLYARVGFKQTCGIEKVILPTSLLQKDIKKIIECSNNNTTCDKSKLERSCRTTMFDIVDLVTKNGQLSQTISCLEVELKKPILSSTIQEKQTLASLPENYRRHLFASLKELMNKLNPITYSDLELKKITQLISEINTLLVKLWVVQVENPSSLNLIPSGKMTQACNTSRLHTDLELINKNINEITTCIAHKNCDEKENRNTKRVLNYLINQHIKNYNQNESGMKLCFDKLLSKTSIKFE